MPKLIAIIDDELEMEFIYAMILEGPISKQLVEIQFFSDPRDFLVWVKDHNPELILSDMNMPHLSGLEVARRMRQMGRRTHTYFVSGDAADQSKKELQELGLCRYISKPLNFPELTNFILTDLGLPLS